VARCCSLLSLSASRKPIPTPNTTRCPRSSSVPGWLMWFRSALPPYDIRSFMLSQFGNSLQIRPISIRMIKIRRINPSPPLG
jgi:hypothetical protein